MSDPVPPTAVDRRALADWCRIKAEMYRGMRDYYRNLEQPDRFLTGTNREAEQWCQGRMESFLETGEMLDKGWDFTKRPI